MADRQILAAGTGPAPLEYTVPNAQTILLKAAACVIDGSGAAGSYIPAVVIESDGGVVICRAADPSIVIAAAASCEVSWFPGVNVQPASGGGGANMPWGFGKVNTLSCPSGSVTVVDFATSGLSRFFGSSGDGTVTLGNVGGGTTGLILNTKGVYLTSWHVFATVNSAPAANTEIGIACDWDTGDTIAGTNNDDEVVISGGPARDWDVGPLNLLNLDPNQYPIPNTGRVTLTNDTTLTVSADVTQFAMRLSTVTDPSMP